MAACCSSIGSATTLVAKTVGSSAITDTASISRSISSTTASGASAPSPTATGISCVSKPERVNCTTYSAAGSPSKTKPPSSPVTVSRPTGSRSPVTATVTPGRAPPPASATEPAIEPPGCALAAGAANSVDAASTAAASRGRAAVGAAAPARESPAWRGRRTIGRESGLPRSCPSATACLRAVCGVASMSVVSAARLAGCIPVPRFAPAPPGVRRRPAPPRCGPAGRGGPPRSGPAGPPSGRLPGLSAVPAIGGAPGRRADSCREDRRREIACWRLFSRPAAAGRRHRRRRSRFPA